MSVLFAFATTLHKHIFIPTMLPITVENNCQVYYKNHKIKYRETKHKEFRFFLKNQEIAGNDNRSVVCYSSFQGGN